MTNITDHAVVVGVSPDQIHIEIKATAAYRNLEEHVEIGSYLKISDDDGAEVIAVVRSYRIKDRAAGAPEETVEIPTFILETQPVGRMRNGAFRRGGKDITIPPTHVEIASTTILEKIYSSIDAKAPFSFGALAQNDGVRVVIDGDRFFGKHIGVVGSTGSGKSCTIARILQEGIKRTDQQAEAGVLNNSHIIIFDLHGEYAPAFPDARVIGVDELKLPYWLMDSEELEEMFIESNEENSHNQISQFRQAVIENKQHHANSQTSISYDAPYYFSLEEVVNYLTNLNNETIGKSPGDGKPKLDDDTFVAQRSPTYFEKPLKFAATVNSKEVKVSPGPFNGELGRFLMRLHGRRNDTRLDFLLSPTNEHGGEYKTDDLGTLIEQITGYGDDKTNVTIIDLSGIPFEVLSVVVSLMSRLIFSFAFHLRKDKSTTDQDLPFLLVYEEAHNYVPRGDAARYRSVKRAIERIAKEGRKYGISLMIVSQRPAEISETVFSQCNNFVAMRLTNPADQNYVNRLLPDNLNAITGALPSLEQREAIVIGDAISVPSLVRVDDITDVPDSHDVEFLQKWKLDWLDVVVTNALKRWRE